MARRRSPARLVAPLALVATAVAVLLIVQANRPSSGDGETGTTSTTQSERSQRDGRTTASDSSDGAAATKRKNRRFYVVKPGDILTTVAEKTGLTVTELEELNPDIDPQALQVGERLRLRAKADADGEGSGQATTATTESDTETP